MWRTPDQIDLTEELRLRSWARMNYVIPEFRDPAWHPVLLDEMRQQDHEFIEPEYPSCGHGLVPLQPTEIRLLHPAHKGPNAPNLLLVVETVEALK